MADVMGTLLGMMGGNTTREIGRQLGADDSTTQTAISAALPLLLGALARNSSTADGADALHGALARDHDGSLLDDVGGFLGQAQSGPGAAILKHVLGSRQPVAEQAVAKASGMDAGSAGKLLVALAPVVLAALGRAQRQGQLDPSGLAGMLGQESAGLSRSSPDLMGAVTRLLDQDNDGSVVDELGGIVGKLFGGR